MDPVEQARGLAREQIVPAIEVWEHEARYPREVVRGSGLTGLFSPTELGGHDLSYPDGMVVFEELGRGDAALGGFSLTEPHTGSDATAITTRATEASEGWRVSGHKAWVSLAGEAGAYGWLDDHPFNRLIALAKMLQVVDGTTEIQRAVIARDLVRRAETL